MNSIKRDFNLLINGKAREIIFTILDEKEENNCLIYEVIDNLLICNFYNDYNLKYQN